MQTYSNVYLKKWVAYVLINCESGSETSVLGKVGELSEITETICTVGNYDIIVKIESDSTEQIRDLITMKIRQIPEITTTTTLLCTGQPSKL